MDSGKTASDDAASAQLAEDNAVGHGQKKRTLYMAWGSVALGVLLLILWGWFVMIGGFDSWLAPIDITRQTTGENKTLSNTKPGKKGTAGLVFDQQLESIKATLKQHELKLQAMQAHIEQIQQDKLPPASPPDKQA